jgi:hypothetical protein
MIVRYFANGTIVTEESDKDDIQEETAPGQWSKCALRAEAPPEKVARRMPLPTPPVPERKSDEAPTAPFASNRPKG